MNRRSNDRTRSRSRSPIRTEEAKKLGGGGDRSGRSRGSGGPAGDRSDRKPVFHEKSDRMVYISNLPYEIKWNVLKDFIRDKTGELAHVEVLSDRDGKSKGAAVVEFDNRQVSVIAVEKLNRQDVGGRSIVVKEIRDPVAFFKKVREDTGIEFLSGRGGPLPRRSGGGPRLVPIQSNDHETYGLSPAFLDKLGISTPLVNRVFVANIPYNCSVGRLYDVFSLAGKINWLDLQMDQDGKSKGIGIVQYSHPIEAVQGISMLDQQRLYDRTLSVKMDRFEKQSELRPGELPEGLRGVGMGLGANGAPLADVASVISTFARPQQVINGPRIPTPFGQIQQQQQQQPITGYSNGTSMPLLQQPNPVNVGYNSAPAYSTPVMSQQQPNLYSTQTQQQMSTPTSMGMPTGYGGTPGQQIKIENPGGYQSVQQGAPAYSSYSTGAQPVSSKNVLIKNLPMDYTWQIVSDRVQQFGELESVEMISPGVAKIRFVRIPDAEGCQKTLHGTTVEGRTIGVEFL